MAKVHEQNHDDDDKPENPETDLDNHCPDDSYPMQNSDIEDLIETHGHYSAKMASSYHISNFSFYIFNGHTLYMVMSMKSVLMTCQNPLVKQSLPQLLWMLT